MTEKPPILLGICQKAFARGGGVLQDFHSAGLVLPCPCFPIGTIDTLILLAISNEFLESRKHFALRLTDSINPSNTGSVEFGVADNQATQANLSKVSEVFCRGTVNSRINFTGSLLLLPTDNPYRLLSIPSPPITITQPTKVHVDFLSDTQTTHLGTIGCEFVRSPPLTDYELSLIRRNTTCSNGVLARIKCQTCSGELSVWMPLVPGSAVPISVQGAKSTNQMEETWICSCGRVAQPIKWALAGREHYFRNAALSESYRTISYRFSTERSILTALQEEFQCLINSSPAEEQVQQFLEAHPVFWNFLGPRQIWPKPPIMTPYRADFAILSQHRILYLIELEKPSTPLVTRARTIPSELEKGFAQIRHWQQAIQNHRIAFLEGLNLSHNEIQDIKYVLVAGLSPNVNPSDLSLVRNARGPDSFLCFDELSTFLHATERLLYEV